MTIDHPQLESGVEPTQPRGRSRSLTWLLAGTIGALLLVSCQATPPTGKLSLLEPVTDPKTGTVTINGVDTNQPSAPFTWNWGDGKTDQSFFPATHTYADRATHTVTVTAHYPGNYTGSAKTVVAFR